jgi:aspartyl-tRNA(Asn)/glutamyl-tRNA(Gln) amidotransferase subunit A
MDSNSITDRASIASKRAELVYLSASEAVVAFRARQLSPVELTRAVLDQVAELNDRFNAYSLIAPDAATSQAKASEQRWLQGSPMGPVDGLPVAIKDVFLTRGWPTLRGSLTVDATHAWEDDAPLVTRLRESGAVLVGKTTTSELGWKGVTDSPLTGITRNPWNSELTPGGSSGGSAAAVALGMAALAAGTDGGGSIRIPAAFTGIVGFKPTFGRVPLWPASPFGTLAHAGPMTRTVADAALMLDVISAPDSRDWSRLPDARESYVSNLEGDVADLRVGFVSGSGVAGCDSQIVGAVERAAAIFNALGAHVEPVDLPLEDAAEVFKTLWYAGAAAAVRGIRPDLRSRMDKGLLEIARVGSEFTLDEYMSATIRRAGLGEAMSRFHERFDLVLTPTLTVPPFAVGLDVPPTWPESSGPIWTPFTYPFNLTQQPAISVPAGFTFDGLPIGLQIVGWKYMDALVLRAAAAYEKESAHWRRPTC